MSAKSTLTEFTYLFDETRQAYTHTNTHTSPNKHTHTHKIEKARPKPLSAKQP